MVYAHRKTTYREACHRKNKPSVVFFTGNRFFSEIQATCPLKVCIPFELFASSDEMT